jgi:hypothetical protein
MITTITTLENTPVAEEILVLGKYCLQDSVDRRPKRLDTMIGITSSSIENDMCSYEDDAYIYIYCVCTNTVLGSGATFLRIAALLVALGLRLYILLEYIRIFIQ